MKIKKITLSLIFMLLMINVSIADFESSLIQTGAGLAVDILAKPTDFFMEINSDIENIGSDPFNKRFQFNTSLVWNLLTVANAQIKYRINNDNSSSLVPEFTPGISYWNIWGLSLIPADDATASASGYTPFLTLAKKLKKDTKFFTGCKYAMGSIKLKIKDAETEDVDVSDGIGLSLNSLGNISSSYNEVGLYAGLNYQRLSGKEVVALIGYYPSIKKLYSKVQISSTIFDYGLSFYPDSAILLHGYINVHFNL